MSDPTPPRPAVSRGVAYWTSQWVGTDGKRRSKTFGRVDRVSSTRALMLWRRWLADHHANARRDRARSDRRITTRQSIEAYLAEAATTYQSGEADNLHYGLTPFAELADELLPDELEPGDAEDYQRHLIARGNARTTVNKRIKMLGRWAKWAVRKGHAAPDLLLKLQAVPPVKAGQMAAREPDPVLPVPLATVEATTAHLPQTVAAMVWAQWHSGMRPGEACTMRPMDIVVSSTPWLYEPDSHKTRHHNKRRVIPLGPEARKWIQPFLSRPTHAYLFQPSEAVRQRRGKPSRGAAGHAFRDRYSTRSYRRAIQYACEAAGVPEWTPNQLRHAALTRIAEALSHEDARVVAGHQDVRTTETYLKLLERDHLHAARVAERVG